MPVLTVLRPVEKASPAVSLAGITTSLAMSGTENPWSQGGSSDVSVRVVTLGLVSHLQTDLLQSVSSHSSLGRGAPPSHLHPGADRHLEQSGSLSLVQILCVLIG